MKIKKIVFLLGLIGLVLLTLSVVNAKTAEVGAGGYMENECVNNLGGVYVASNSTCYNVPVSTAICPDGYGSVRLYEITYVPILHGAMFSLALNGYTYTCGYVEFGGMEKEGRCKFFSMADGYLGGTVEVEGLGLPSVLRLVNEEHIYKLPLIETSVERDDVTGRWTAQFATIDPATGQPLVSPGSYFVSCYGSNGTASGAGMQVTITR